MALLSDDQDIQIALFRIETGGNGDYYPQIFYKDSEGLNHTVGVRIAMSGGNAPTDVKLAVADLYRALEKHGLNEHPINEPEKWDL
jgi:hypothetical protein